MYIGGYGTGTPSYRYLGTYMYPTLTNIEGTYYVETTSGLDLHRRYIHR